ncbi:hypothetical protein JCM16358_11570 [Halanaerocella petrolearia]
MSNKLIKDSADDTNEDWSIIEEDRPETKEELRKERKQIEDLYYKVADHCNGLLNLLEYEDIKNLIKEKWGFTKDQIDNFKIGYMPPVGQGLVEWVKDAEVSMKLLKRSGLINKFEYDHFQGRIIFPYWNDGNVVSFIGRKTEYTPDDEYEQGKYIKLLTYQKNKREYISQTVENKFLAGIDSVKEGEPLLITEGITDCYRAIGEGFACISPVTTTFREEDFPKLYKIAQKAKKVYIANDSEENEQGRKGAEKTAKYLAKKGIEVRIVELPRPEGIEKVDLADFLTEHSAKDLKDLLNQALEYRINQEGVPVNIFEKIKNSVNIIDVWDVFGDGQEVNGNVCCPFHDDNTPSMGFKEEENYFNCFGCEAGGGPLELVKELENVSALEAAKMINEEFNLDIDISSSYQTKRRVEKEEREREKTQELLSEIVEKGKKLLRNGHRERLKTKFGLSEETIKEANVGYLGECTYKDLDFFRLKELGLAIMAEEEVKPTLKNCYIVPYINSKGKIDYIRGVTNNKISSPRKLTPSFAFGQFTNEDTIVVVKNELEVLALKQYGYDCVCAKTLVPEQLKRYEDIVILNGNEDIADSLLQENLFPKFKTIPDGKTIGEHLNYKENIYDLLDEAEGFLQQKYEEIKNSENGRKAIDKVDKICEFLASLDEGYHKNEIRQIREAVKEVTGSKNTLTKSDLQEKIEKAAQAKDSNPKPWFSGDNFKPALLGDCLMENHYFLALGGQGGSPDRATLYYYAKGVYKNNGETKLQKIIQQDNYLGDRWKKRNADDTVAYIKRNCYKSHRDVIKENTNKRPHLINVKNGMIDLKNNSLSDHDPVYNSLNQLDVEYRPEVESQILDEFMKDVLIDSDDPNPDYSKIDVFWEFIGWTIYSGDVNMKKMLFLLGDGNNGKSELLKVITSLLGGQNYSSLKLQTIAENDFAAANLFGKLANINGDLDSNDIQDTSLIKQLTGGDIVSVDQKYKDRLEFKNRATFIFALNNLPKVKDYSKAYFNRLIILETPNTFTKDSSKYDPKIGEKITTEVAKSHALNKALEGIKRLEDNDWQFTRCKSSEELISNYIAEANSVVAFLKETCEETPDEYITKEKLYQEFKDWSEKNGYRKMTKKTFGKRVAKNPIIKVGQDLKFLGGKTTRIWTNIDLKFKDNETGCWDQNI